ncbi:MAG: 50S ribosomal protein L25 [Planctomycetota bacterium]|jgi:large subunit ribosomal protein L25
METPNIPAERRDRVGSRYAQRLRSQGRLPAVIYGHKQDPVAVSVDEKQLLEALHHGAHLINIQLTGAGDETCLVKDLQFGYLGDNVIHVDLTRVDLDEEVEVAVHLHFLGEPAEAKKPGAILTHNIAQLQVACRANAIPDEIPVDLHHMHDTLTVGELTLPEGVRALDDPGTPVAQVTFVHEAEPVGEEVEVEAPESPEVITESKKEEADGSKG